MQQRRNEVSKTVGAAKKRGEDAADLVAEVQVLKEKIAETEETERALGERLDRMLAELPNLPGPDVPSSEARRAGQVCVSTCRSCWSPSHLPPEYAKQDS